jgi:ubiquitin C-terminal hydrolase
MTCGMENCHILLQWNFEYDFIADFLKNSLFFSYVVQSSICAHGEQFRGSDQHDSQEFLSFLLDGIHEDLNRVLNKSPRTITPEREAELERLPQQIASEQEWHFWKDQNDSLIVDFFQGQFRNRLECMTCHKVHPTLHPYSQLLIDLDLDINNVRSFHGFAFACAEWA